TRGIDADAGVVTGGQARGAEFARAFPEEPELHVLVAPRARVRRPPREVFRHERLHDVALERLGHVEHVVREAEAVSDGTRVVEVVERAAVAVGGPQEPERDANHVVARRHAAGGRDGAVDATAHRRDDPLSPHAAAPPRTWATRPGSTSSTRSTSTALVVGPRLSRRPPRAASASRPMARS